MMERIERDGSWGERSRDMGEGRRGRGGGSREEREVGKGEVEERREGGDQGRTKRNEQSKRPRSDSLRSCDSTISNESTIPVDYCDQIDQQKKQRTYPHQQQQQRQQRDMQQQKHMQQQLNEKQQYREDLANVNTRRNHSRSNATRAENLPSERDSSPETRPHFRSARREQENQRQHQQWYPDQLGPPPPIPDSPSSPEPTRRSSHLVENPQMVPRPLTYVDPKHTPQGSRDQILKIAYQKI